MFYVFQSSNGFDRATASTHETLESAGSEILWDDQSRAGVDLYNGEMTPWQQPHRGDRRWLLIFARATEKEALEAIAMSEAFGLECFTEEQAARYEADGEEGQDENMQTFTIIESNSGLVWGTATAPTITEACRIVDEGIGAHGCTYEECGRSVIGSGKDYYIVHTDNTGSDFMAEDYKAVSALPVAGYVIRIGNPF